MFPTHARTKKPFQRASRQSTGQAKVYDLGRADGYTPDDFEWAYEQGAVNQSEAVKIIDDHRTEMGR